jgi:hypothetical protein
VRTSILTTGTKPILDIECHCDVDLGLQLADKSIVPWAELKVRLEVITWSLPSTSS